MSFDGEINKLCDDVTDNIKDRKIHNLLYEDGIKLENANVSFRWYTKHRLGKIQKR